MKFQNVSAWAAIALIVAMTSIANSQDVWQLQESGVKSSLRGLCVLDEKTAWASGTGGTVIRTHDGGRKWIDVSIGDAKDLDFRDIHAIDAQTAVVMSSGQPARIYRTSDAGKSWSARFEHPDKRAFFDAISFWDQQHGIAMSDPIDGHILLVSSADAGKSWNELPKAQRPSVLPGEAGFAASGTNMIIAGESVFIALGGAEPEKRVATSRVLYSADRAQTWQQATLPIERSDSGGIFSLAFANEKIGVAVGGDYLKPELSGNNIACTDDGGRSWQRATGQPPRGYRSAVTCVKFQGKTGFICVGPSGTDLSTDSGQSWKAISDLGFHAVAFGDSGEMGFASGAQGRIARWKKRFSEPRRKNGVRSSGLQPNQPVDFSLSQSGECAGRPERPSGRRRNLPVGN